MTASPRCCTRSPDAGWRSHKVGSRRRRSPPGASAGDRAANAGRLGHDLHALAWAIELHHAVGAIATDHWRTPRYATGRYPVPQVGSGRGRHPITLNEIPVPDGQAIIDVELKNFSEVKPDVSLELRIDTIKLTFECSSNWTHRKALPTTGRSSSLTTPSCAAGVWRIPGTEPRAPGPSWCS